MRVCVARAGVTVARFRGSARPGQVVVIQRRGSGIAMSGPYQDGAVRWRTYRHAALAAVVGSLKLAPGWLRFALGVAAGLWECRDTRRARCGRG